MFEEQVERDAGRDRGSVMRKKADLRGVEPAGERSGPSSSRIGVTDCVRVGIFAAIAEWNVVEPNGGR